MPSNSRLPGPGLLLCGAVGLIEPRESAMAGELEPALPLLGRLLVAELEPALADLAVDPAQDAATAVCAMHGVAGLFELHGAEGAEPLPGEIAHGTLRVQREESHHYRRGV